MTPADSIFQGMPDEWKAILHSSNISKQEQKNNPQAVIDVLKWFESKANNKQESKYMTAVKPSSGKADFYSFVSALVSE